ncbi:RNA methyltransferase [Candidatus Marsarchaeota archaeon]|nr:RNA methyltransferase [Candidatus Marsarchaeota archaeon]
MVEPEYQINLGYAARVLKNFGLKRIYLINPKCDYKGRQALKYAKHASDILEHAVVCSSIGQASKGSLLVGTTALWRKTEAGMHNVYTLEGARRLMRRSRDVTLLIGRDGTGLTREELAGCDATVFIPASDDYPTLNITHALAIMLYGLLYAEHSKAHSEIGNLYAGPRDIAVVKKLFDSFIAGKGYIRDKRSVSNAFYHMIRRSAPTKQELRTLAAAFSLRAAAASKTGKRKKG